PPSPPAGSKAKGGSVRFAPAQPPEGAHGHVHFEEKLRDSAVMVTQERDGSFLVKVGAGRAPGVTRALPGPSCAAAAAHCSPLSNGAPAPLQGALASAPGYSVKCEYTAHKEGVLKEEMVLASEAGEGATIRVVVQARVMGK
ncbi:CT027 protein, partial [Eolophus roseicapillus]|nr:CT027 protein [Eolophus roseicapilla]